MEISEAEIAPMAILQKDVLALLLEHPFIEGMERVHVEMMAKIAQPVHFNGGEIVFHQDGTADRLYLILKGCIALEVLNADYGPIPIQMVETGDVLGSSWFVPPYKWRFDARAVRETEALGFDAKVLLDLCERQMDFGYDLMKRMAAIVDLRLNAACDHLQDAYSNPR